MSDDTKDALETTAATGLAIAGAVGAPAAAIPGLVGLAWMRLQNRRIKRWWELVLDRAIAPVQLVDRIVAGLAGDDEKVVAGVVGGARAAASAMELAAVPVVAALSRRYFQDEDLPLWFYRGALEVLERVDAVEIGTLLVMFEEVCAIEAANITVMARTKEGGSIAFVTSSPEQRYALTQLEHPARLFSYMKRAGLGFDSGGFGLGGLPDVLVIERSTAKWLLDALREGR